MRGWNPLSTVLCLGPSLAWAALAAPLQTPALQTPAAEPGSTRSHLTQEMLSNGGFENGAAGWKGISGEATIEGACVWSGRSSLRIEKRGGSWCGVEQEVRVRPGTLYRFEAWVKLENAWQSHYKVVWFNGAGNEISQPQILGGTDGTRDWFFVERLLRSPSEACRALVYLLGGRGLDGHDPGRSWFDEVSMVELTYRPLTAAEVTGFPSIRLKGASLQTVKATKQGKWLTASNGRFALWLEASSGILARADYLDRPVLLNQALEFAVNDRSALRSELLAYRVEAGRLETRLRVTRPGWNLIVDRLVELSKDTVEFSYRLKSAVAPFHLETIRAPLLSWRPFAREPRAAWFAYSIWVGDGKTVGEGDKPASFAMDIIGHPMQYPGGELQFPGMLFYEPASQGYLLTWCRAPKVGVYLIPDLYGLGAKFCYHGNLKPGEEVATPKSCFGLGRGLPGAYARIGRLCRAPKPPEWWFHTVWFSAECGSPFFCLGTYRKIAEWIPEIARTGANGIFLGQGMFGHQMKGGSGPTNWRPAPDRGTDADLMELARVARAHGMRLGAWVTVSGLSNEPGSDWKDEFGVRDSEGKLYVHCPARPPLIPYHEIVGFDLANPAVKRYLRDAIVQLVTKYGIDYVFLDSASLPVQPNFSPVANHLRYPGESMPSAIPVVDYLQGEVAAATKKEVAWGGEGMTWDQALSIRFYRHGPEDPYSHFVENINRTGQRVCLGVTDSFHGLASGVARLRQAYLLSEFYWRLPPADEGVLRRLIQEAQQDRLYIKLSEIIKREGFDGARLLNDHVIQLRRYLLFDEGFRGQIVLKLPPNRWYLVTDLLKNGASRLKADSRGNLPIRYEGEGILHIQPAFSTGHGSEGRKEYPCG